MRILLLGGTTEANELAKYLAAAGVDTVYSYAGRTEAPSPVPMPTRVGGFGGVDGLRVYLRDEKFTHVVDATHPFAAQISRNVAKATSLQRVQLVAMERPPWTQEQGDKWKVVKNIDAAIRALPNPPSRIFLAIGRQDIAAFSSKPQHKYVLRFVDATAGATLPGAKVIVDRGPFDVPRDVALMKDQGITYVVSKNSGGTGAVAKIIAARQLGLPVIMINRPMMPRRLVLETAGDVMEHLGHARLGV